MGTQIRRIRGFVVAPTHWFVFPMFGAVGCIMPLALLNLTSLDWKRRLIAAESHPNISQAWDIPSYFLEAAEGYEQSNPDLEAASALSRGDRRLLAVEATSPFIPGTEDEMYEWYERRFGVRLPYTGCVVRSEAEVRYRRAADTYAELYNRVILEARER